MSDEKIKVVNSENPEFANYENVELVDAYEKHLKADHLKNVDDFFQQLTEKSKVDVEQNKITIAKLYKTTDEQNQNSTSKRRMVALKVFLWVVFVLGLCVAASFFYNASDPKFLGKESVPLYLSIIIGIIGVLAAVGSLTLNLTIIKKKLKEYREINAKLEKIIQKLDQEANQQMSELNSLFNWNQPLKLFEKTIPLVKLDDHFNPGRWDFLRQKYGLENLAENENITFVQSGEIKGNPFVFVEKMTQSMFMKTYTGSITITWTETYRDSEGKTQTRTRSEVLTASLKAPAPKYENNYYIIYGNEAAPNLSFSRVPSDAPLHDEKALERYLHSETKALEKKATKAVQKGRDFNLLTNTDFEVLFGAMDRDNEIEYRLLFTPIAQRQTIKLLTMPVGHGDYFQFHKQKKVNLIYPMRLEMKSLETNVEDFKTNDYEKTKALFTEFNVHYFDSIIFSLFPLLCIPLYQQYKPAAYIYEQDYGQVSSPWEYEVLARKQNLNLLKHPQAVSTNLFKTQILNHHQDFDQVAVKASSFEGINRITTFQVFGGDGHFHTVPVHWIEYLPVEKTTSMVVKQTTDYDWKKFNQKRNSDVWRNYFAKYQVQNNDIIFHRNLISFVLEDKNIDDQELDNLIKGEE